jgi:hypothetical protein
MPKVVLGGCEADANKAAVVPFAHGGDKALDRFGGHFVENLNGLARQQRSIHDDERAVGAYVLREGFEVDGLAFGHLATHLERNLERYPYSTPSFGISGPMHEVAGKGDARSLPCFLSNDK